MGDTRKKGHVIPMSFEVMKIFESAGFKLKEVIIKEQHNVKQPVIGKQIALSITSCCWPTNIYSFSGSKLVANNRWLFTIPTLERCKLSILKKCHITSCFLVTAKSLDTKALVNAGTVPSVWQS